MRLIEFYEREFYINLDGVIFDNSLNLNNEDSVLKVSKKKIMEIYNKQDQNIKDYLEYYYTANEEKIIIDHELKNCGL